MSPVGDSIIVDLQAVGRAGKDWTDLAQDRDTGGRIFGLQ